MAALTGPPAIVSTTINAPIGTGGYQLKVGQSYNALVNVQSGSISYNIRLERNAIAASLGLSPTFRDDTVTKNSGYHPYTFTIHPTAAGDFPVAFQLRDRGTGNVFSIGGGIDTRVTLPTPPSIVSTTINATVSSGRYQLTAGQVYTVAVKVVSGEVSYNARVEGSAMSPTLHLTPDRRDATITKNSGQQTFFFTIKPDTLGNLQAAFRLRDLSTGNVFNTHGGVPVSVNSAAPRIVSTTIEGVQPTAGGYNLTVGKLYTVLVRVQRGVANYEAAVETNDQIGIPGSANLHNSPTPVTRIDSTQTYYDFRFSYTPTAGGSYAVGFMLRDAVTGNAFGHESGIDVVCTSPRTGIHGVVTARALGTPIAGVTVTLDGGLSTTTAADGSYRFAVPGAGQHTLRFEKLGFFAPAVALHVPAPSSGIGVDVALEEPFDPLLLAGITYTMYLDYEYGRSLLHVVRLPRGQTQTAVYETPQRPFETARQVASRLNALVTVNGGYFNSSSDRPVGYFFGTTGYRQSEPFTAFPPSRSPVLGIVGTGADQVAWIVEKDQAFTDTESPDWNHVGPIPLWDDNQDGVSDVSYAIQADPLLLDPVDLSVPDLYGADFGRFWPRTAVGVHTSGDLLVVAADGEGLNGYHGASLYQLGYFFRDVLGATEALNFDGGGSTQMILCGAGGPRSVTTLTSEHPHPPTGGRVLNFIMAWRAD